MTRVGFNPADDCYVVNLEGAATIPLLLEASQTCSDWQEGVPAPATAPHLPKLAR